MTHRTVALRGAGIAALVLLLAGCAAPTPSHTRSASTPKPTATSTPTAASKPGSRVPVGCDGLLDTASWSALAGSAAKVDRDEDAAPTNMTSIAQLQFGALTCIWDGSGTNQGSLLEVDVAPDSKAAFETNFSRIMGDQSLIKHPAATQSVAGDESGFWCATNVDQLGADFNLAVCDGEMLVGNYWVSVQVSNVQGLTRAQLLTAVPAAMTGMAAKLTAAGPPVAQWPAPASTPPAFCSAGTSTAIIRSVIGDNALTLGAPLSVNMSASTVGLSAPYSSCDWTSKSAGSVTLQLLAGGSWALPGFAPIEPGDSVVYGKAFAAVSVGGATSAQLACNQDVCDSFMAVGTTVVQFTFLDLGPTKDTAALSKLAAAIDAS